MSYASLDDLRSQLGARPQVSAAYAEKMLHTIPDAPVVDRAAFILKRCEGKRVLEFGASGPLHEAIVKSTAFVLGFDREPYHQHGSYGHVSGCIIGCDLDDVADEELPLVERQHYPELIVCGEVLEHLTNPGHFLRRLKAQYDGVPVIVTVPNCYSIAGRKSYSTGIEMVNRDHVAWYSHTTIMKLLEKCGYAVLDWAWYNGQPLTAEGLVVVCV